MKESMTAPQDKLNRQVQERISSLSDEDLLTMLAGKRSDYTPLAWGLAREELSRRGGKDAVRVHVADKDAEAAAIEEAPTYTGEGLRCDLYNLHDYAGYWKRSVADLIDGLILSIALALFSLLGPDLAGILGLVLLATYHVGFKGARGNTPGYRILRIRIVSIDGAAVSINQIAVRQISAVISALACGLGFIWIAFDPNKQSWHDKIAGTYVIKTEAQPVGAIGLPRRRVVRVGLFATLSLLLGLFVVGSYVAGVKISQELKGSEAYHLSEEYLRANSWIQQEVGTPTGFDLLGFTISTEAREFTIHVSGDTGEVVAKTEVERIGDRWMIKEAGYSKGDEDYVDITKPLLRKK